MEVLSSRILLRPRDLERSQRFYEEALGLPVYHEWGAGAHRGVVFFLGGGLLEVSGGGAATPTDAVRVWIQVRDIAATHARLLAAGVAVEDPPQRRPWGLDELVARDPDGFALVFVEVPPEHPLRRGRG